MLELTKENFKKEVLESAVPVLVDFFAPWCGPCKVMLPVIEELAKESEGKNFKAVKVNVDENNDLAQEYEVMSIPTFVIFKNGKETERMMGVQAKERLEELLGK